MTHRHWMRVNRGLGVILAVSLCVTEGLILLEMGLEHALPLHLCSISALLALAVSCGAGGFALDFLWYIGMPAAAAALMFPSPAVSRYQHMLNLSYAATHLLIIAIPVLAACCSRRPASGRGGAVLICLVFAAVPVSVVNRILGTDYMFLSAPPANTPLETAYAWGVHAYFLCLMGLCMLSVMLMQRIIVMLFDVNDR